MQRRERKDEGLALAREPVLLRADSNQIKASRREQSRRVSRTGFLPAEYRSNREAYLCDASRERFGFNNYDTAEQRWSREMKSSLSCPEVRRLLWHSLPRRVVFDSNDDDRKSGGFLKLHFDIPNGV